MGLLRSLLLTLALVSYCPTGFAQSAVVPLEQLALWDTVMAGDVTKVLDLIKTGADVNRLDIRVSVAGPNGRRPLNYAALQNDTAMITALLEH